MRPANDACNTQIWILTLLGGLALFSRYNNVYVEGAGLTFANFSVWPLSFSEVKLFPVKIDDTLLLMTLILLLGAAAYLLRSAIFLVLNASLSYVAKGLTERHSELLSSNDNQCVRIKG